jgi:hypothetical protein
MRPAGEDRESYAGWAADLPPRAVVRHPAVPLIYRAAAGPPPAGPPPAPHAAAAAPDPAAAAAGGGGPGAGSARRKGQRYFDLARDAGGGGMALRRTRTRKRD